MLAPESPIVAWIGWLYSESVDSNPIGDDLILKSIGIGKARIG